MADQYEQLANYLVWPTESDHHGDDYGTGAGLILSEPIITADWYYGSTGVNRVISGFLLPTSGSRTNATITAGQACVGGYIIKGTDAITVDFEDATTSYVYLELVVDGVTGKVSQPVFDIVTTRLTPATTSPTRYCMLLGTVVTAGGLCTASGVDMRQEGRHVWGAVTHSDAGTPTVFNYGSANWEVTRSSARSVITFDIPFAFKAPTVIVSSDNGLASTYAASTTTATIDGTSGVVFSFHCIG